MMLCKENFVDYKFKIALIGDSYTGKSTLLRRLIDKEEFKFIDKNNNDFTLKTIGVDFKHHDFVLDKSNINVSLSFFDTSGDEQYRLITNSYIENMQAFIIAYDVQNMESFQNCQYWLNEITKRHSKTNLSKKKSKCETKCNNLILILVGCKNDIDDSKHVVPTKKARDFAKRNGFCLFYETSSKENLNVKELFEELCMELISNYIKYLNYQEELLNLISIPCTNRSFMLHQNTIPLNAISSKSDVYFNCSTERLNFEPRMKKVSRRKLKMIN